MSEKLYSVYMHTTPDGKKYIGLTSQYPPEKRFANGNGYAGNAPFYRAIQNFGWDKIKHEIISSDLSADEAATMEIQLIKEYDSTNPQNGYNRSKGGEIHIEKDEFYDCGYPEYFIDGTDVIPKCNDEIDVIQAYDFLIGEIERIKKEYEKTILEMQMSYFSHLQSIYDYSESIEKVIFNKSKEGTIDHIYYGAFQSLISSLQEKHIKSFELQCKKVYGGESE